MTTGDSSIGTMIGTYRIDALLGKGGMGAVYRATDTKLNRPVAIKMLALDFADAEARRRFQREAQLASSLNHPHILTVFDGGEHEGRQYLVTEFVEGGTLKDWIQAEKRTPKQIAALLAGVADALAEAHDARLAHRDIKPANILISKSGHAKLADFGLAKLQEDRDVETTRDAADLQTQAGVLIGTIAYMSPEQASGQKLDSRSDIFSFGVVLYEMLAGQRPFQAKGELELLKSIIERTPEPLPTSVPPALVNIVDKTLEKDPAERYQSARDLAVDLRRIHRQRNVENAAPSVRAPRLTRWLPWVAAALLGVAALAIYLQQQPGVERTVYEITPPTHGEFSYLENPAMDFAISPDGRMTAFRATLNGETRIWIRDRGDASPRPLPGTEGASASAPFWSPDSRSVAFFAGGQLKIVPAEGGPARVVCRAPQMSSGTWGSRGDILFADFREEGGIFRVRAEGGMAEPVVAPNASRSGEALVWPQFLPDGQRFFYMAGQQNEIWLASLAGGEPRLVMKESSRVAYVRSGFFMFARDGALLAQRFNLNTLRLENDPITVVPQLQYFQPTGMAQFSISDNGVLAYRAWGSESRVALVDRSFREVRTILPAAAYLLPVVSPDGKRIVVAKLDPRSGTENLHMGELTGGPGNVITSAPGDEFGTVWLDNETIVFTRDNKAAPFLHQLKLDGSGKETPLTAPSGQVQWPTSRLPDGAIVYQDVHPETRNDLWLLRPAGKPEQWLATLEDETMAAVSPDGAWLAYVSDATGSQQVYVRAITTRLGPPRRISLSGGLGPRWSRDGRELYFLQSGRLMLRTNPQSESGSVTELFRPPEGLVDYDVAPGGNFVVNLGKVGYNVAPITVVIGWESILKQ